MGLTDDKRKLKNLKRQLAKVIGNNPSMSNVFKKRIEALEKKLKKK